MVQPPRSKDKEGNVQEISHHYNTRLNTQGGETGADESIGQPQVVKEILTNPLKHAVTTKGKEKVVSIDPTPIEILPWNGTQMMIEM